MGKGEISQDSHDKLYTDLIHRFMRKEDVESPWFLREAPEDDQIKNRVMTALNKKQAEDPIFDKVYKSIVGKQLDTRIQNYIASHKDADIGTSEMAFLVKEIPQLGKTDEVKQFVGKWNKGEDFIDVNSLVPDTGMTAPAEIQSIVGGVGDIQSLNVIQRKSVADAIGISVGDLLKISRGEAVESQKTVQDYQKETIGCVRLILKLIRSLSFERLRMFLKKPNSKLPQA